MLTSQMSYFGCKIHPQKNLSDLHEMGFTFKVAAASVACVDVPVYSNMAV